MEDHDEQVEQCQDTVRPLKSDESHPPVSVTLTAVIPNEQAFYFDPITFELAARGPRMTLCRANPDTTEPATVSSNKIKFASHMISRNRHCQIWVEDNKRVHIIFEFFL